MCAGSLMLGRERLSPISNLIARRRACGVTVPPNIDQPIVLHDGIGKPTLVFGNLSQTDVRGRTEWRIPRTPTLIHADVVVPCQEWVADVAFELRA